MNILKFHEILHSKLLILEKVKNLYQIEFKHFVRQNLNEFSFLSVVYENEISKKEQLCINGEIATVKYVSFEDGKKYNQSFNLEDLKVGFQKVFELINEMHYDVSSIRIEKIEIQGQNKIAYIVKSECESLLIIDATTGVILPNSNHNFKSINGYDIGYIFSKNTILRRIKLFSPSMVAFDNDDEVKNDEFYTITTVPRSTEIEKDSLLDYQVIVHLNDKGKGVPYQYEGMLPYIMNLSPVVKNENLKVSDIVNAIFASNGEIHLRKSYYYYFYKPYLNQYETRYISPGDLGNKIYFEEVDFIKSVLKAEPSVTVNVNSQSSTFCAQLSGIKISWELGMDLSKAPMTCPENFQSYNFTSYTSSNIVKEYYKAVGSNLQQKSLFKESYFYFPLLGFYTVGNDKLGYINGFCSYEFMPSRSLDLKKNFTIFPELPINSNLRFNNVTNVVCKMDTDSLITEEKDYDGAYLINLAGSEPPKENTDVPLDKLFIENSTITLVLSQRLIMSYIFERFINVLNTSDINQSLYFHYRFAIKDNIPFDGSNSINLVEMLGRNYVEGEIKINMKEYFLDLTLQLPVDSAEDNIEIISYRFYPFFSESSMYLMSEKTHSTSAKGLALFTQKFQAGMDSCFLTEDEKEVIISQKRGVTNQYDPQPLFNDYNASYYFGEGIIIKDNYAFRDGHLSIDIFKNQNS